MRPDTPLKSVALISSTYRLKILSKEKKLMRVVDMKAKEQLDPLEEIFVTHFVVVSLCKVTR